jgi:hypothetical protein
VELPPNAILAIFAEEGTEPLHRVNVINECIVGDDEVFFVINELLIGITHQF